MTVLSYLTINTINIGTLSQCIHKSLRKGFVSQYWWYWLLDSTILSILWATCRIYKSLSPLISLIPGCCDENWKYFLNLGLLLFETLWYFNLFFLFSAMQDTLVISWSGVTMICISCRWRTKLTVLSYPMINTDSIGTLSQYIEKLLRKGWYNLYLFTTNWFCHRIP